VSHTNTAVDEALLQIAERVGDRAQNGAVLRVGIPKESKLKAHPELLLSTQVEKRSTELTARISVLEEEQREKTQMCLALQRLIAISDWIEVAVGDIERASADLESVQWLEAEANVSRLEFEALREGEARWSALTEAATSAKQAFAESAELRQSLENLKRSMVEVAEKVSARESELAGAKETLRCAEALEPLRERRQRLPALAEQSALARYTREAAGQKHAAVSA
jgi:hypothetical protein